MTQSQGWAVTKTQIQRWFLSLKGLRTVFKLEIGWKSLWTFTLIKYNNSCMIQIFGKYEHKNTELHNI